MREVPPTETQSSRLWRWLMRPQVLGLLGGGTIVLLVLGYGLAIALIKRVAPPIAAAQLKQILNREVEVGTIEELGFGGVRLTNTVIPAAPNNQNRIEIAAIEVRYQVLPGLLWGRLPVQVTIERPQISLTQNQDGSWLNLDLNLPPTPSGEPPIDPQIKLQWRDATVKIQPQGATTPLTIASAGGLQLRQKTTVAAYDLQASIGEGDVRVQGETQLKTLASRLAVQVDRLQLTEINRFLPPSIAQLQGGTVRANLAIQQPALLEAALLETTATPQTPTPNLASQTHRTIAKLAPKMPRSTWEQLLTEQVEQRLGMTGNVLPLTIDRLPQLTGTAEFSDFEVRVVGIPDALRATGQLQFQGNRIGFDRVQANLGEVVKTELNGFVGGRSGFDLAFTVLPVDVDKFAAFLLKTSAQSPLSLSAEQRTSIQAIAALVSGDLTSRATLTGVWSAPQFNLALRNTQPMQVDRLQFPEFRLNLQANADALTLQGFRLSPAAGGQIQAQGRAEINAIVQAGRRYAQAELAKKAHSTSQPLGLQALSAFLLENFPIQDTITTTLDDPLAAVKWGGQVRVDLPLAAISAPYALPPELNAGTLSATGQLTGTAAEPLATLAWDLSDAAVWQVPIASRGEIELTPSRLILKTAQLLLNEGTIEAQGQLALPKFERPSLLTTFPASSPASFSAAPATKKNTKPTTVKQTTFSNRKPTGIKPDKPATDWGAWQLQARSTPIDVTPWLQPFVTPTPQIRLTTLQAQASGNLNQLTPEAIQANLSVQTAIEDGFANLQAIVAGGQVKLSSTTTPIDLTKFLGTVPITWRGSEASLQTSIANLLNIATSQRLGGLDLTAIATLGIADQPVISQVQLQDSQLTVNTSGGGLDLGAIATSLGTTLPIAATLDRLNTHLTADLADLIPSLIATDRPLRDRLAALTPELTARWRLGVETGAIDSQFSTNFQGWSLANAGAIPLEESLLTRLSQLAGVSQTALITSSALPLPVTIDTQLSGSLTPLIDGFNNLMNGASGANPDPIEVLLDRVLLQLGSESEFVALNGRFRIRDWLTQPDLDTNVQIAAAYDSDRLPFAVPIASLHIGSTAFNSPSLDSPPPSSPALNPNPAQTTASLTANPSSSAQISTQTSPPKPATVNLAGAVNFQGQLVGLNLLTAPIAPGNLSLWGNLTLDHAIANDLRFEPRLSGNVIAQPSNRIELDLRGDRDRIAARLVPCQATQATQATQAASAQPCLSPFIPDFLDLRYTGNLEQPVHAQGDRQGEIFNLSLRNFDLALLQLAPATQVGINGNLAGDITANLALNLYDLRTQGQILLDRPRVGYLNADRLAANFSYRDGIAYVDRSQFNLGQTQYNFAGQVNLNLLDIAQGRLNLKDLETILASQIRGELTVEDGQVTDLIAAFKWSDLADLTTRQVASPSLRAEDLTAMGVGSPDRPILEQLNEIGQVSASVTQQVAALEQPAPPRSVDLRGRYDAQVMIDGTLGNPSIEVAVAAEDWQWYTQPISPLLSEQLGITPRSNAILPIEQIQLRAAYRNGVAEVNQADIRLDGTTLNLAGSIARNTSDLQLTLNNFSLNTVRRFASLPIDADATVNLTAQLQGGWQNPSFNGSLLIDQVQLQQQPIDPIMGAFGYRDQVFRYTSQAPDWLYLETSLPFPLQPSGNVIRSRFKLGSEALALLKPLSQNKVEWLTGALDVDFATEVELAQLQRGNQVQILPIRLEANGKIDLDRATFRSPIFPQAPIELDGQINLARSAQSDQLQVDQLMATIGDHETGGKFVLNGVLPIFGGGNVLENPLTLNVAQSKLNIKGLYRGNVDGQVTVTGNLLRPRISGRLGVEKGRLSLPRLEQPPSQPLASQPLASQTPVSQTPVSQPIDPPQPAAANNPGDRRPSRPASQSTTQPATPPLIQPFFNQFDLFIGEDFRLELEPLFNFRVQGNLALNGIYDGTLNKLKADGEINIKRGRVNALSNLFFTSPGREHTVTFDPDRSLLDPFVDLELATLIYEDSGGNLLAQRDPDTRELPDLSLIPNRRSRQLLVTIGINQYAQNLLTALQASNNGNQSALLDLATLRSVPNRDETLLVSLLGNQVLTTVSDVAQLQGAEFIEFATLRFVVEPTITNALLGLDNVVNQAGDVIGLDRLSIFPPGQVEGTIELTPNSLLRLTYDYGWNGLQLRNNSQDTGANNQSVELRYEFRF